MYRKLTVLFVLAALGLSAAPANAFFDNVAVSPRARGMGETAVAVPDGPYATYHNPGLLASNLLSGASASYVRPFGLSYTDHYHVGAALPAKAGLGGFGIGLTMFKVEYEEVNLLEETQLSLGYGHTLYSDMHATIDLGGSINMYHVDLGETVTGDDPGSDTVLGVDLGLAVRLHKRTRLGVLVKNLNNPQIGLDDEELPKRLIAGASYEPYDGVITTFEIDNELGRDSQYHGGVEMMVLEGFALRAGVITNPNKLTAGFGYHTNGVGVDYGFSTGGGVLENTHQFGVNVTWGGEAQ